jgi:ABC-type polysaccharide/polyol phosphate transport system ATPase subunit
MKQYNAIEVHNVKKKFKIYYDKGTELKEKVIFSRRKKFDEHWVLKGISFEVKKGDAIGLVGKNGCGKSTTLKMLTKIMYPDSGEIEMSGRVSSLLELGAGFHPDMTGKENIYINSSIFGLSKKEIDEKIDTIIEFSELEEYIDNPVRTYSSGMYMRLAFSVAINVNADILLIDEILGVGDVSFQKKCFDRLKEIKDSGTTIVIVSHSLGQIEKICDRSIWIQDGLINESGVPEDVHKHYLDSMEKDRKLRDNTSEKKQFHKDNFQLPSFCCSHARRRGNYDIIFDDVTINDNINTEITKCKTGDILKISMFYKCKEIVDNMNIAIRITRTDGVVCFSTNYIEENGKSINCSNYKGIVTVDLECHLMPGIYNLDVIIVSNDGILFDEITCVKQIDIAKYVVGNGVCYLKNSWYAGEEVNE